MLSNFFKVIFRYLFRSRFFTLLNVAGLSIGISSCIVIYLFIGNEISYDKFHAEGDKIYRVVRQSQIDGMPYNIGVTSGPFANALKQDFDERIEDFTRAYPFNGLVRYNDKSFIEERLLLADRNFFQFFSFPLAVGDKATILAHPNTVVITRAMAQKYFGATDPIGKALRLENEYDLEVTGIMDELPGKTHLRFDAVASIGIVENEAWFNEWWNNCLNTYVRVNDEETARYLNASFPDFMTKYFGKDFERVKNRISLKLEPLHEIYFNYDTRFESSIAHGDKRYLYVFGSIGLLLILLASINYINLATAQSAQRAKEVGIRKTLGSGKISVALQFLSESFVLCCLATILALVLAQFTIPLFQSSFNLDIPGIFSDNNLWIFLAAMLVALTLLSGGYPSFLLSSFKPIAILKGNVKGDVQYLLLRKVLVILQFAISAFMIIATLFIGDQLNYMREKNLGFDIDQVMVLRLNNAVIREHAASFKEELLRQKDVVSASLTSGHPGGFYDATTVNIEGMEDNMRMRTLWTDEDLANTMDLEIASGRFFSKHIPSDSINAVLLNETAVRQLGLTNESVIGKRATIFQFDGTYKEIVGVVKDYHFTSVKEKIEPLIISYSTGGNNLLIKLKGGDISASVATVQDVWTRYNTGFPMETSFLDDVIENLYTSETAQGKIFTVFSVISVLIACLGILGLASYIASQRRKEIGIRKVLGATPGSVSVLLVKDLLKLVAIACLLAMPVVYVAIDKWAENFPYRVSVNPVIFAIGSLGVTLLSLGIIAINASRVAMENPVKALRSE